LNEKLMTEEGYGQVVNPKTWKRLTAKRAALRGASYQLLAVCTEKLTEFVRVPGQLERVATMMASIFNESDMLNISSMWDAVLVFYRVYPEAWTLAKGNRTDFNKTMFPQLMKLIKSNFRGCGKQGYPPLLPFLAMVPADISSDYNNGGHIGFVSDLFKALDLVNDAPNTTMNDVHAAVSVKIECATYLLVAPIEPSAGESDHSELLELCLQPIVQGFHAGLSWPPRKEFYEPLQKAICPLHRVTIKNDGTRLISSDPEKLWNILLNIASQAISSGNADSISRYSKDLSDLLHPILQTICREDLEPDPGGFIDVVLKLAFQAIQEQKLKAELVPLFSVVAEELGLEYVLASRYNSVLPSGLLEFYERNMNLWVSQFIEEGITIRPLALLLKALFDAAGAYDENIKMVWWNATLEKVAEALDTVSVQSLLEIGKNFVPNTVPSVEAFTLKVAEKLVQKEWSKVDYGDLDGLFYTIGEKPYIANDCVSSLVSQYLENPQSMDLLSLILLMVCGSADAEFRKIVTNSLPGIWTLVFLEGDENELITALGCPLEEAFSKFLHITETDELQPLMTEVCSQVIQEITLHQPRCENLALLIVKSIQMAEIYKFDAEMMDKLLNDLGLFNNEQWEKARTAGGHLHQNLWQTQYEILNILHEEEIEASTQWAERISCQGCPKLFWEMMIAYMCFVSDAPILGPAKVGWMEASSWWCSINEFPVNKSPALKIKGLEEFFFSSESDFDFFYKILKEGVSEAQEFIASFSRLGFEEFVDGVALRLEMLNLIISLTVGKEKKVPLSKSFMPETFQKGGQVLYEGQNGEEEVTVLKVHYDDGVTDPYFSIRLSDGKEKQTVGGKLKRLQETEEAENTKGEQRTAEILDILIQEEQMVWKNKFEKDVEEDSQEDKGRLALLNCLVLPCLQVCGSHETRKLWFDAAEKWISVVGSFTSETDITKVSLALEVLSSHYKGSAFIFQMIKFEETLGSLEGILESAKEAAMVAKCILELIQLFCSIGSPDFSSKPYLERLIKASAFHLQADRENWLFAGKALCSILTEHYLQYLSKDFKAFLLSWTIEKLLALLADSSSCRDYVLVNMCIQVLQLLAQLDELPSMWAAVRDHKEELLALLLSPSVGMNVKVVIYETLQGEIRNRKVDFREVEQNDEESKSGLLADLETYFSKIKITEEVEKAEISRDFQISSRILPSQIRLYLEQSRSMKAIKAASAEVEEDSEGITSLANEEPLQVCTEEKTFLLVSLLLMDYINSIDEADDLARGAISSYISHIKFIPTIVELCFVNMQQKHLTQVDVPSLDDLRISKIEFSSDPLSMTCFCMKVFYQTLTTFPALLRQWWSHDCRRGLSSRINNFTKEKIGPLIMQREIDYIRKAAQNGRWGDTSEMSVKGSKVSREVTATYMKDECALEVVIKVPPSYPLCNVEVQCTKRLGITEGRWRRWVMQIVTLLSMQDGTVLDAILLWKQNVDKEFEGVEPCPICFSILYPKDHSLPSLVCRTCSNKFHSSCLYKWFHTSHKNKCPLCQQPF